MSSTDSPLSSLISGGYQEIAMTPENKKEELVEIALANIYLIYIEAVNILSLFALASYQWLLYAVVAYGPPQLQGPLNCKALKKGKSLIRCPQVGCVSLVDTPERFYCPSVAFVGGPSGYIYHQFLGFHTKHNKRHEGSSLVEGIF